MFLLFHLLLKKVCELESLKRVFLFIVREQLKDLSKEYDKSENDLKALQSVGQVCKNTVIYLRKTCEQLQNAGPCLKRK